MKDNALFTNCISLGWYCGTAGSMAKFGFRSFSGPFDWFFSEYPSVIYHIENGFKDFLDKDNLVISVDNPKRFDDTKYGYTFFHDISTNLNDDYPRICERYRRRIVRFYEKSSEPTLYLRTVRSEEEKQYIIREADRIGQVLKKLNPYNEVVYLFSDAVGGFPKEIKAFNLHIEEYRYDAAATRNMFDQADEFINYCGQVINQKNINKNKQKDRETNYACAADVYSMISQNDDRVRASINHLFELSPGEGIVLYGIGYQGRAMYDYLKRKGISVLGIVDGKKHGQSYQGHRIMAYDEVLEGAKVLISIADGDAVDGIRPLLAEKGIRNYDYRDLLKWIDNYNGG